MCFILKFTNRFDMLLPSRKFLSPGAVFFYISVVTNNCSVFLVLLTFAKQARVLKVNTSLRFSRKTVPTVFILLQPREA